ncbi:MULTISPECIES: hypothetical protein [unclassified Pseudomonas]|uniref:hypothetical protein n=1 Tax=Pseudomonas sp. MPDS TaxID=2762896 RepID=UPI0021B61672|nr:MULTISPECIES: hypothetical protein [unclassified Pseudomonas]
MPDILAIAPCKGSGQNLVQVFEILGHRRPATVLLVDQRSSTRPNAPAMSSVATIVAPTIHS